MFVGMSKDQTKEIGSSLNSSHSASTDDAASITSDESGDDGTYISTSEGTDLSEGASEEIIADNPSECIIIAGAFSDMQNADDMENLLARNGYEVYTENYGIYKRVGFTYDCENVDLAEYLNNFRSQIEPKAWYLVPDFYVEYE